MDEPFIEIGDKFVSKALDNRIAVLRSSACIEGRSESKGARRGNSCGVHDARKKSGCAVREHVGVQGAVNIGISIDTTLACTQVCRLDATTVQRQRVQVACARQ
jgi:endoglucanase